jgi:hypothetical protein
MLYLIVLRAWWSQPSDLSIATTKEKKMSDPKSNVSFIEDLIKYYMTVDYSTQIAVVGAIMTVLAIIIAALGILVAFIYSRRRRKLARTKPEQFNDGRK